MMQTKDAEISLNEVSTHDSIDNCWVVLFNNVYDLTAFVNEHPGGAEVLLEHAGRDATLAFQQAGHQTVSESRLEPYKIGQLPTHEWFDVERVFPTKSSSVFTSTPSVLP
ncbi:unnamed protein product [Nesidiocoris tenuis]|uniref:Cytochrome b5 heme-binding domain-containing protein n=1 Tax=Nesidiocoris tenuis TaxID=355587 RepID=A0A6H5GGY3_9HEMI|nr:unnamed protein product [Nesidiocoris tenuis]